MTLGWDNECEFSKDRDGPFVVSLHAFSYLTDHNKVPVVCIIGD